MIRIGPACALFASTLAFAAHGADTRETRPVSGFHAISMGVAMDLDVIQDGTESLSLEGDADALSKIETSVSNGKLEIKYKPRTWTATHGRVHGVVHARHIDAVALAGAGNVRSPSLDTDALALSISGSGDMDIAGKADTVDVHISGSGGVKAPKLETQRAQVNIAGSGSATLWVKQQLTAAISGVGNVRYYGDPQVTRAIRGVGHVERIAAAP